MKQRVSVHYSVDIEELPTEVENLLNKAQERLGTCHKELQTLIKNHNQRILMTNACTQDISKVREELANVDFILNDATNIIKGFVSYQLQEGTEEQPANEGPPTNGLPPGAAEALEGNPYIDAEQLQEKIQQFRESLTK